MRNKRLKELGVNRIIFHETAHLPLRNNLYTMCAMLDAEEKPLAMGIAICSVLDNHNRKIGKSKAFGRAFKALLHKKTTEPIYPDRFLWDTVKIRPDRNIRSVQQTKKKSLPRGFPLSELIGQGYHNKSVYKPPIKRWMQQGV